MQIEKHQLQTPALAVMEFIAYPHYVWRRISPTLQHHLVIQIIHQVPPATEVRILQVFIQEQLKTTIFMALACL